MSRQLETRGGWRIQSMTRCAGFLLVAPLLLSPLAGAPVAATGTEAPGVLDPAVLAAPAPGGTQTELANSPNDGLLSRREPAWRGAAQRAQSQRATSLRHPVGGVAPDLMSGSGFTLRVDTRGVAVLAGAAWRTAEGVSHADGIRGPPEALTAAPRMSSRP